MIRSILNSLALVLWTVVMVSFATCRVMLERDPRIFNRLQTTWGKGILKFIGSPVTLHGGQFMDPEASYVVVSNHQSYLDIPVVFHALPTTPGFVAKKELERVPFLGKALDMGGHVLIDRSNHKRAHESIQNAAREIREGKTVLIFPEGTCSDTQAVMEFKSGAFRMAKASGVPILPIGLRGTARSFPYGSALVVGRGPVAVHVGEPIMPEEYMTMDLRELSSRLRQSVGDLADMPLL